jgi:hypothetical protein
LVDGGAVVSARELARVRAAMAARFLRFDDDRGRRNRGRTNVPWRLEGVMDRPVGLRPTYGCHGAPTWWHGHVADQPH